MNRLLFALLLMSAAPLAAADETAAQEATVTKGIAYLGEGRAEKADLYLPPAAEPGRKRPGIVLIHGGGWVGGRRNAAREVSTGHTLAGRGYVCLSIDYMLQPKDGPKIWPQNLHDCKTAVRWLRANAEKYGIDTDRIGVMGGSAGGHLAVMVGVTGPESGLDPEGPYGEHSCRVHAVVDFYGPIADGLPRVKTLVDMAGPNAEALSKQVTPLSHLDEADPPVLIVHGTADKTVPVRESKDLAAAMKKAGVAHELIVLDGAPHSFALQPEQRDLRPVVVEFFDKHLRGSGPGLDEKNSDDTR